MHIYPYAVLYDYLPLAEVGIFLTEIKCFLRKQNPVIFKLQYNGILSVLQ